MVADARAVMQTSSTTTGDRDDSLARFTFERFTSVDDDDEPKKPDRLGAVPKDSKNPTESKLPADVEEYESDRAEQDEYSAPITSKFYGEVIAVSGLMVQAWIEVAPSLRIRTGLPVSLFSEIQPISGVRFIWHESTKGIANSRVELAPGNEPTPEDIREFEQLCEEFRENWANQPLPLDEND